LLLLLATGFNGWIFLQGEQPDVYTLSLKVIITIPRSVQSLEHFAVALENWCHLAAAKTPVKPAEPPN
ncbi:MAG: hypothetical protein AAF151_20850, partial [Cyanobacteria bacterium J06656_5]